LCGERIATLVEFVASVLDVAGAALHLGHVDESGLVEVGETAAFMADVVQPAVEAGQFCGE
jgi:hypothetical protein